MTQTPDNFRRRFDKEQELYPEGSVLWSPCPGLPYAGIPSGHTGRISFWENGREVETEDFVSFEEVQRLHSGKQIFNTETHAACPACLEQWNKR